MPMATTVPIINTILSDVNAIIPDFQALVSSYRLLVGAAEEIHRIPGLPPDIFQRSVTRFDNSGTLIDIVLELLCCKIAFTADFLGVTCAPVDLFRLLENRTAATDTPFHTAEQILQLEALRRIIGTKAPQHLPVEKAPFPPPEPPVPNPKPSPASTLKRMFTRKRKKKPKSATCAE